MRFYSPLCANALTLSLARPRDDLFNAKVLHMLIMHLLSSLLLGARLHSRRRQPQSYRRPAKIYGLAPPLCAVFPPSATNRSS